MDRIVDSMRGRWSRLLCLCHNRVINPRKAARFKQWLENIGPRSDHRTFFSDIERDVEVQEGDRDMRTAVLTCYFTRKADPQLGIIRLTPDIGYIAPWYDSIVSLGLNGIILHDGLDREFIEKYQNDHVQFRQCIYGNYSIFEERWFAYHRFISQTGITHAFCTDCNDVYITRDPFANGLEENVLYVGRDLANRVRHSGWLLQETERFRNDSGMHIPYTFKHQPLYNAGVLGGNRNVLLAVMSGIINLTLQTRTDTHKDMTLLNLVIHNHFPVKLAYYWCDSKFVDPENDPDGCNRYLRSGHPLNSAFKKEQMNSDAIFIHK